MHWQGVLAKFFGEFGSAAFYGIDDLAYS